MNEINRRQKRERKRDREKWPAHHNEHITVYLCAGNWFVITKWLITVSIGQKLCFSHSLHPFMLSMDLHLQSLLHNAHALQTLWIHMKYSRTIYLKIKLQPIGRIGDQRIWILLYISIIDFKKCHAVSFLIIYLTNCFDSNGNVIIEF